jgi:hypothetical protein
MSKIIFICFSYISVTVYCQGQKCVELYLHSPNTPAWRGAQLKQVVMSYILHVICVLYDELFLRKLMFILSFV